MSEYMTDKEIEEGMEAVAKEVDNMMLFLKKHKKENDSISDNYDSYLIMELLDKYKKIDKLLCEDNKLNQLKQWLEKQIEEIKKPFDNKIDDEDEKYFCLIRGATFKETLNKIEELEKGDK